MKLRMLCNVGTHDASRLGLDANKLPKEGEVADVPNKDAEKLLRFGVAVREDAGEVARNIKAVPEPSNVQATPDESDDKKSGSKSTTKDKK